MAVDKVARSAPMDKDQELKEKILKEVISKYWHEANDVRNRNDAQQIEGKWFIPIFGCDTVDSSLDEAIDLALKAQMEEFKTAIEKERNHLLFRIDQLKKSRGTQPNFGSNKQKKDFAKGQLNATERKTNEN